MGPKKVLVQNLFYYKVIDRVESYNLDKVYLDSSLYEKIMNYFLYKIFRSYCFDLNEAVEQVCGHKRVIFKFRHWDDTTKQV